ncbi:hypothetical protein [Dethiobacter alkaliphilus]|uniref:hypothetical protein n=1 Tax=Dethiobacter alkaliphilus TaxID=427926 RepID=UPI0022270E00|nr:hypothetical protein [Dethiobacter alkaliphilus]MCW3489711.1 hypothetical protein [Dethiobacter alkaliphilus]
MEIILFFVVLYFVITYGVKHGNTEVVNQLKEIHQTIEDSRMPTTENIIDTEE